MFFSFQTRFLILILKPIVNLHREKHPYFSMMTNLKIFKDNLRAVDKGHLETTAPLGGWCQLLRTLD